MALADIAVDVVLGHQNPHIALLSGVATRPHTLYAPQPSLAGLIARDLAIGAGGASIWEDLVLVCRAWSWLLLQSASLL